MSWWIWALIALAVIVVAMLGLGLIQWRRRRGGVIVAGVPAREGDDR